MAKYADDQKRGHPTTANFGFQRLSLRACHARLIKLACARFRNDSFNDTRLARQSIITIEAPSHNFYGLFTMRLTIIDRRSFPGLIPAPTAGFPVKTPATQRRAALSLQANRFFIHGRPTCEGCVCEGMKIESERKKAFFATLKEAPGA